jgi:Na+/melibiose symporter-like transporter
MPTVLTRHSGDRRRFASAWFKRQIAARVIVTGCIVLVAVCFALGAVGIGIGIVVLAGIAVLVHFERQRRWRALGRPEGPDLFPDQR